MAVWSSLGRALQGAKILNNVVNKPLRPISGPLVRTMSGHHGPKTMALSPSRWQWTKFKDMVHFYLMVAVIPMGLLSAYVNIFIGTAKLAPIPEGYEPAEWEYFEHPITRFLVKYVYSSRQQDYEKNLHILYEEMDKMELRRLRAKVKHLMQERRDYQAWYFTPFEGTPQRRAQEDYEKVVLYERPMGE